MCIQPQHPDFPYIIFSIAVLKDIIDPIDISGIGVILTTATSFLVTLIIFIWFMGKMNLSGAKRSIINRLWKRMIQSKLWLRFIGLIGLEYVPFLKILPGTTILILMIHFSEKKIVKLIDAALEEILASKIK